MHIDNLVHMANRIGEFFQAMPDREESLDEIAQHLRKFWEPRMRRELLAHLDGADGAGLLAIVKDAVTAHREALAPAVRLA
ncbi:MAG TPA: formate dehydrogenase subunit delta [Ramlibacter sp.]|nr:formate dehydrogenase subunit delta [Ramlibacter sp.]